MDQDRTRRKRFSRISNWVVVFVAGLLAVLALTEGRPLPGAMWTTLVLSTLVEATGLDERLPAARRLGRVLTAIFVALAVVYLYTRIVS